jgi:hypothetical protein
VPTLGSPQQIIDITASLDSPDINVPTKPLEPDKPPLAPEAMSPYMQYLLGHRHKGEKIVRAATSAPETQEGSERC